MECSELFVWVQDGITRLIHEDLVLRFPVASSYFLPWDTSSLFTACGLDGERWRSRVKIMTEENSISGY